MARGFAPVATVPTDVRAPKAGGGKGLIEKALTDPGLPPMVT